jgi:hypothetical protein
VIHPKYKHEAVRLLAEVIRTNWNVSVCFPVDHIGSLIASGEESMRIARWLREEWARDIMAEESLELEFATAQEEVLPGVLGVFPVILFRHLEMIDA